MYRVPSHFFCIVSCSILLHLNIAVFLICTIFMVYIFYITVFSSWTFSVGYSFHVAPFFVLQCFHVVPFVCSFHVATFFMLHYFHVEHFFLDLHFWHVFYFILFMVSFLAAAFLLTAHFLYYTLPCRTPFMSQILSVALFSCCTLFIMHSSMAIFHSSLISCCGLLRLHFFKLRFFHVAHFHFNCFFSCCFTRLCYLFAIFSESIYNPFLS